MAIHFKTDNPHKLLEEFKKAIEDKRVNTWLCEPDGYFTHSPDQWIHKAWFLPKEELGQLTFYIIRPTSTNISMEVYAVYHGRFIESMLIHCDKLFELGIATALPISGDNVSGINTI